MSRKCMTDWELSYINVNLISMNILMKEIE